MAFEGVLILFFKVAHVVSHMTSKNVLFVYLWIKLPTLIIMTREAFCAVRYVQSTINSTFECSKDPGTSGGTGKTHIKVAPECPWLTLLTLHMELIPIHICVTFIDLIQFELL